MTINSTNAIVSVTVLILIVVACANPPKTKRASVNIPDLVGKSPQEVDKILGPAMEVIDIPDGPDSPGEYRDYRVIDKGYILSIRFFRGKPARFICDLTPPITDLNASESVALFGFDVNGKSANRSMSTVTFWQGNFGGVMFQDVRLTDGSERAGFREFRATPAY